MAGAIITDEARLPGRPREFAMEEVLDGAIRAFSEDGYSATSIADLAAAMNLSQGSIYKAFRDKRSVLSAALERYVELRVERLGPRLAAARTGRERVEVLLKYYADNSCGVNGRRGCLIVSVAAELGSSDPDVVRRLAALFASYENDFAGAIRVGQADGSVAAHVDAASVARSLLCVVQGMRVVGKAGRAQAEMRAVVADALRLLA